MAIRILQSGRMNLLESCLVFGILSYCNADEAEVRKLVTSRLIYNRLLQDCGYVEFNVDENFDIRLVAISIS